MNKLNRMTSFLLICCMALVLSSFSGSWISKASVSSTDDPLEVRVSSNGAAGDAILAKGSINAGQTIVTLTQTILSAYHVGKTMVVKGAGPSGTPLIAKIVSCTSNKATLSVPASTTVITPERNTNVAFGTDDTEAINASANQVISRVRIYPDGRNVVPAALVFEQGIYIYTGSDMFGSPSNGTSKLLRGLTIRGGGRQVSSIIWASTQGATTDQRQGNLFTLANQVRGMHIEHIGFNSFNENQSLFYMWCSSKNDGTYPAYGSGSQNDCEYYDVELSGSWKRGWGFDGDSSANQNSEQSWRRVQLTNDATFTDAVVRSGFAPLKPQMDQFLNYSFYDCNFEYAHGDCLVFDKGGFINVYGGSWIMGINDTAGGSFFKMGNTTHFDDAKHLNVSGTRFEARNNDVKLIDTYWSGGNSHITFENISIASNLITAPAEWMMANFRSTGNSQAQILFQQCQLPGYIMMDMPVSATDGRIVFRQCNFRHYKSNVSTPSTSGTFLRYKTGTPKWRFNDCSGALDANN